MARWNKLNEEEYYFSQKTLPPHEIKSAKNTEPIRYDINNYIENDDITIDDFYEQVTTLINGFQRTHQGTYLLFLYLKQKNTTIRMSAKIVMYLA